VFAVPRSTATSRPNSLPNISPPYPLPHIPTGTLAPILHMLPQVLFSLTLC
jgi:hypothetical protein